MEKIKRPRGRPPKFTDAVRDAIFKLKEDYEDWSGVQIYNNLVGKLKSKLRTDNPHWSEGEINDEVKELFPSLGLVQGYVTKLSKAKESLPELDNTWSLGSCLEYDIALDVVMPLQRQLLPCGRFLTIRRARWYSKLYPALSPLLDKYYPGQVSQNQLRLMQIASFYTRAEQIAEINGKAYPDTRTLDNVFIFNQDVSFETTLRAWLEGYLGASEKPTPLVEDVSIERILGKTTDAEIKLLNKFIGLLASYDAGEADIEKLLAFTKDNPNMQPLIEKWLVLSLRRDIQISVKGR